MARRLTSFSKLLITLLILAAIFFLGKYVLDSTSFGQGLKDTAEQAKQEATGSTSDNASNSSSSSSSSNNATRTPRSADDKTLRVQLVTWGGYAPGLYFNEGAKPNSRSRYLKDYGFNVEFILENDLFNALDAWIAGEYDVLVQTADAFPLYTAPGDINQYKPKAFMQVDWSRGGDAIIVKRGINSVNDLKGKRVVVAVPSPAQTLLLTALEAAGLSYTDVNIIKTSDNIKAAELFRSDEVDAAVVWSPDDILATRDVPGSKILLTTKEQSHIIGDIMFAKEDVIAEKQAMFDGFYEGWMKGVAELRNDANLQKAGKYMGEFNDISTDDAIGMMSTIHWTSHEDNKNFFGLNPGYKGQKGSDLYTKMSRTFVQTGDAESVAPTWRSVINTSAIRNASKLSGAAHAAEAGPKFAPPTAADRTVPAFAAKPLSINFATGQYALSENAKTIIDLQFAEVAKAFGNVKVRVEGNTDNVGSRELNQRLSRQRAESVANYLRTQYSMDQNRFVIVGNGPDKPVSGCETNASESCKAKNRRTEFQLIQS